MLALAGCDQAPASMPITAASMSELAVVNNKVNDLTAKVEELEKNMPSLEDRVHVLKLGATGYSQIDAGIGVLTFQFTEIAAKGSGSNVSLLIGNPTNAAITDMTIWARSEEHTSELQSLMRISYAVFCLKKKNQTEH